MKGYIKLNTPIRVGEYYRNGMSCCKVLEASKGGAYFGNADSDREAPSTRRFAQ